MTRSGDRGVSNVVAVALLIGLVFAGAGLVVVVLGGGIGGIESGVADESVVEAFRSIDEAVASFGAGGGGSASATLPAEGSVEVRDGGEIELSVNGGACTETMTPGALVYERDGVEIHYAAGGIWRVEDGESLQTAAPAMAYQSGTVDFGVPAIDGTADGREVTVTPQSGGPDLESALSGSGCERVESLTVAVRDTPLYDAWGAYLREEFPGNVTVDDGTRTARLHLTDPKVDVDPANGTFTSETTRFDATVSVERTRISAAIDATQEIYYPPMVVTVARNGSTTTPWPDGDVGDTVSLLADDMNDPTTPREYDHTYTGLAPNTTLRVDATSYECDDFAGTGSTVTVDGTTFDQFRCDTLRGRWVGVADGPNRDNRILRRSGEPLPRTVAADPPAQVSLPTALGGLNEKGLIYLPPGDNTAVFFYELTRDGADPANVSAPGDPDYNDLIVTVEIEHADHPSRIPTEDVLRLDPNTVAVSAD